MTTIQEKAKNLIDERNKLITRFNEINGSLTILDELAQEETETETTTEEES
jgi:hypothetical protein|tara:strand:- start:380 stop:532 length:153 start_codon:yes stop_codon:yes gene_type:complete